MDIWIYSDESGVFDNQHNELFVFGGLVFLSYKDVDEATRLYTHAEHIIRQSVALSAEEEAKACRLPPNARGKLFRSLNRFHKFGVVIKQQDVLQHIFSDKKSKQRYLDYVFKVGIRRKLETLILDGELPPQTVKNIRFYADEHTTATNGRYELQEALEHELKIGTYNNNWTAFHPPLFPRVQSVSLHFCDSQAKTLIRAADIVANRVYFHAAHHTLTTLQQRNNFTISIFPEKSADNHDT